MGVVQARAGWLLSLEDGMISCRTGFTEGDVSLSLVHQSEQKVTRSETGTGADRGGHSGRRSGLFRGLGLPEDEDIVCGTEVERQ